MKEQIHKVTRSSGIPVSGYIVGGGYSGLNQMLDDLVVKEAAFLRDHFNADVTIRFNSDRLSGGAWLVDSTEESLFSNSSIGLGASLYNSKLWNMQFEERMNLAYSDIELVVVLPFEGHDIDWDDRSRCRMRFLIQHSAGTVVTGTADEPKNAYKSHYYYMIDHADCLLAVYDNNRSVHSETSMIVHYAQQKSIPVIFVHPDTAEVSREGYHYKQCGTYGLHEHYTDKT